VKCRRRDAPLTPPQLALAGEQPVAEQRSEQVAAEMALAVVRMIGEQYVLDVFRLVMRKLCRNRMRL